MTWTKIDQLDSHIRTDLEYALSMDLITKYEYSKTLKAHAWAMAICRADELLEAVRAKKGIPLKKCETSNTTGYNIPDYGE